MNLPVIPVIVDFSGRPVRVNTHPLTPRLKIGIGVRLAHVERVELDGRVADVYTEPGDAGWLVLGASRHRPRYGGRWHIHPKPGHTVLVNVYDRTEVYGDVSKLVPVPAWERDGYERSELWWRGDETYVHPHVQWVRTAHGRIAQHPAYQKMDKWRLQALTKLLQGQPPPVAHAILALIESHQQPLRFWTSRGDPAPHQVRLQHLGVWVTPPVYHIPGSKVYWTYEGGGETLADNLKCLKAALSQKQEPDAQKIYIAAETIHQLWPGHPLVKELLAQLLQDVHPLEKLRALRELEDLCSNSAIF